MINHIHVSPDWGKRLYARHSLVEGPVTLQVLDGVAYWVTDGAVVELVSWCDTQHPDTGAWRIECSWLRLFADGAQLAVVNERLLVSQLDNKELLAEMHPIAEKRPARISRIRDAVCLGWSGVSTEPIRGEGFGKHLGVLGRLADDDDHVLRDNLYGVWAKRGGEYRRNVSTNGHMLLATLDPDGACMDAVIPGQLAKLAYNEKEWMVNLQSRDDTARVSTPDWAATQRTCPEWPKEAVQRILNEEPEPFCTLTSSELRSVLRRCEYLIADRTGYVDVSVSGRNLVLSSVTGPAWRVKIQSQSPTREIKVRLLVEYLRIAAEALRSSETLVLSGEGGHEVTFFDADDGSRVGIMPARVD